MCAQIIPCSTLFCTSYWCNLKNSYYWRLLLLYLEDCAHFINVRKMILLTLLFRIYTVYILNGTPTESSFFNFTVAVLFNMQRTWKNSFYQCFSLSAGTFTALIHRTATGFNTEFTCWMYSWSQCMSAHLHIPQAFSQSFCKAREGPDCQPAQLHSCTPWHTPNRFHIAVHNSEPLYCGQQAALFWLRRFKCLISDS